MDVETTTYCHCHLEYGVYTEYGVWGIELGSMGYEVYSMVYEITSCSGLPLAISALV